MVQRSRTAFVLLQTLWNDRCEVLVSLDGRFVERKRRFRPRLASFVIQQKMSVRSRLILLLKWWDVGGIKKWDGHSVGYRWDVGGI